VLLELPDDAEMWSTLFDGRKWLVLEVDGLVEVRDLSTSRVILLERRWTWGSLPLPVDAKPYYACGTLTQQEISAIRTRVRHPASIVGLVSAVPGAVSPTTCWLFSGEAFRFGKGRECPHPRRGCYDTSDQAVDRGPPSWMTETRDDARGDPCASAPVAILEAEVPSGAILEGRPDAGQETSVLPVWRGPSLDPMAFVDRASGHLVREMEIRIWKLEHLGSPPLASMELLGRRERTFQRAAAWAREFQAEKAANQDKKGKGSKNETAEE
jgi:hypothetical protein